MAHVNLVAVDDDIAQVLAQAAGPLLSGVLRDITGDYRLSLQCFGALAMLSVVAALVARQPRAWPAQRADRPAPRPAGAAQC